MKGQRGAVQADYGVSVIVTGMPTSGRLERLMGLDFDNYEIVVVADLQTEQHAQEIIRRYSMTRVNVPAAAEFRCDAIRTLLRSRQRRYRKLVIADCAAPPAAALNCAISVSSFGRIMVIDRRTCLNRGTLMRMDAEFESCSDGMICAVSAPVIDMNTFGCDTAVEIVAGEYSRHISMIDRDYAISTGGFSEDNEYMARMLADLRDIPGLKLSVIRTPACHLLGCKQDIQGRRYTHNGISAAVRDSRGYAAVDTGTPLGPYSHAPAHTVDALFRHGCHRHTIAFGHTTRNGTIPDCQNAFGTVRISVLSAERFINGKKFLQIVNSC